jgi:hypothetical protein
VDADTIAYVNIKTGEAHEILYLEDMGWDMGGVHFGRFYNLSIRGWIYITTYSEPNSQSPLRNTAFMLEIKSYTEHPRIWRIADTKNQYNSEDPLAYEKEAYSPISADGTTIYWGADWRGGDGTVDTYKVQLPQDWWFTLRSSDVLAIRVPICLIHYVCRDSLFCIVGCYQQKNYENVKAMVNISSLRWIRWRAKVVCCCVVSFGLVSCCVEGVGA